MSDTVQNTADLVVVEEVNSDPKVGEVIGQCKWWSDKLGYGFITAKDGSMVGKDIFIHHTGIRPLNSNYKTLKKGEYINFDILEGDNGLQASNVTGILGGSLICDVNPYTKPSVRAQPFYVPSDRRNSAPIAIGDAVYVPITLERQYTHRPYHTPKTVEEVNSLVV
jgi:cold shock CspA family protein